MTKVRSRPAWIAPAAAALVGALVGFLLPAFFGPSRAAMRDAAAGLVPEAASVTDTSENTGSGVIVGSYFALVEFESGTTPAQLEQAAADRAEELGWSSSGDVSASGAATVREYTHEGMHAEVRVLAVDPPIGSIQVERDGASLSRRRVTSAIGGAIVALALVLVVRRLRERVPRTP